MANEPPLGPEDSPSPKNGDPRGGNEDFIVQGCITRASDKSAVAGITVRIYDQDLRKRQKLHETKSDSQGHYRAAYRAKQFSRAEQSGADLVVVVSNADDVVIAASPVRFNAKANETIHLVIDDSAPPAKSEFEHVLEMVLPLLDGQDVALHMLEETADHGDFSFLTQETGLPSDRIITLVNAAKLTQQSADAAVPKKPAGEAAAGAAAQAKQRTISLMPAFYGLLRQGLPADLAGILTLTQAALRDALETSLHLNIIPAALSKQLDAILAALQSLKVSQVLRPAPAAGGASLGDLLSTALPAEARGTVAELYVKSGADAAAFRTVAQQDDSLQVIESAGDLRTFVASLDTSSITPAQAKQVKAALTFDRLTDAHTPLVQELARMGNVDAAFLDPKGLAALGQDDWLKILARPKDPKNPAGGAIGHPSAFESDAAYAKSLVKSVVSAFPTAAIAANLVKDDDTKGPFGNTRSDLTTFFKNNPTFSIGQMRVKQYLAQNADQKLAGVRDRNALASQLGQMERVSRFSPAFAPMRALLADGIDSAHAAAVLNESNFINKYADAFSSPGDAKQAYAQARTVTLAALNTHLKLGRASNIPSPKALDPGDDGPVNTTQFPESDQADWTLLFGSIDLCDCEDCQALDSPAAYFVDVLDFLRQNGAGDAVSPLDALLERRPDLAHIELTCDNTNIRLPYIDLVNEVLEGAIADPSFSIQKGEPAELDLGQISVKLRAALKLSDQALVDVEKRGKAWAVRDPGWRYELTAGEAKNLDVHPYPQTSGTEEELAANPQHINYKAYALIAQAGYPWSLPFNLPIEEARAYLKQLGVARSEVIEAFEVPDKVLSNDDIAYERLGLSSLAANIVTGVQKSDPANAANAVGADAPWTFWGFDTQTNPALPSGGHFNGSWDAALRSVRLFLTQSGLTYPQLLNLLDAYFLNPKAGAARTLSIISTDQKDPATCDVDKLQLVGLTADILRKFHRFVRLMNRLGWSVRDLDRALTALSATDLTSPVPRQLAHIDMLQKQFAQPLVSILAFWADIDSALYTQPGTGAQDPAELRSLYVQLFRSKSLGSPADSAFTENPNSLQGSLSDHTATILGALRLSADDFAALTSGSRAVVADGTLNLGNLSMLYRYALLAQSLQLSIPDMLRARVLFGDPFVNPETTLWFVRRISAVRSTGFDVAVSAYLLRHEITDNTAQNTLNNQLASVLSTLRDQLKKIADDNIVTPDPQGTATRAKLTFLKWNETYIAQAISLLSDANIYSTTLAALPGGLVFPANLADRVSYDAPSQMLSVRGVLSTSDKTALQTIAAGAGDLLYQGAVQTLFTQSRADAQTFLVNRMRAFELPQFVAPAAPQRLAQPVIFPDVWKNRIQYNASTGQLAVTGALTEGELAALLLVSNEGTYVAAVQSLFDQAKNYLPDSSSRFLVMAANADTAADPAHTAFNDLFDQNATPADRFAYVLTRLCTYIKRVASESLAKQTLSDAFNLNPAAVSALLTTVLAAPSDQTKRAMADLVAPGFVASSGDVTGKFYAAQFAVMTRVQKIATIATRLKLTSDLIILIDQLHVGAAWLDWNALPVDPTATPVDIKAWETLVRALGLRRDPLSNADFEDLLTQANGAAPDKAAFVSALSSASQWPRADIEALMGPGAQAANKGSLNLDYPDDFKDGSGLRRLRQCFKLMAKIGASPQQLAAWKPLDLADDADLNARWNHAVANATAIKNAVRSKYTDDIWLTAAAPIRNRLRDLQRAALVDYLVAKRKFGKDDIDLYDYFLIDVDMGSCMKTTRLSQAICSVQLFVQRCLLNVEAGETLSLEEATEWNQWRCLYRVWQANRKVLLYPENWIEPSQRDDKSPIFKDLENELQQNDVTADTAEAALRHYLQNLDIVGRLEIVGICTQTLTGPDDITHVFGRTYAVPHTYFHRQWQSGLWSPWTQVDLDIDGDHLVPTVWNNHLYLCWPLFTEKTNKQTKAQRDADEDPTRYWEIKLAWSEYLEGRWQPKHVSTDPVRYDELLGFGFTQTPDDVKLFGNIQTGAEGPKLIVDCFGKVVYTVTQPPPAPPPPPPDLFLLMAGGLVVTIITFTVNGQVPSATDLAHIVVRARRDKDNSLKFTNPAKKWDTLPGVSLAITLAIAGDPVLAFAWGAAAIALATNPLYGVIVLDTDSLDYFLSNSIPFTVTKSAPNPSAPPLMTWLQIDLAPMPASTGSPGPTITAYTDIRPLGRFVFSTCRSDVSALPSYQVNPAMLPRLIPPANTLFKDEMIVESPANWADTLGSKGVLGRTPGTFRVLMQSASYSPDGYMLLPFAYQDARRTYYVTSVTRSAGSKVHFQLFFHPNICSFIEILDRTDVKDFLTLDNQSISDANPSIFEQTYFPNSTYVDLDDPASSDVRTPREIVDFTREGAYSLYNWEIFFHIPLLIATKLSTNQRFQEARDWFHYIFDPTSSATGGRERFWKFKPFFDAASEAPLTLDDLIKNQTGELENESIALAEDPFQPFLIARMRPLAFMKAVVMKYLDNLIAWGDQLFARDQMESVSEATQLYVLAARILGRRPDVVPTRANPVVQTFSTLKPPTSGVFLDALVAIESYIFPSGPPTGGKTNRGTGSLGTMPLFCIPKNDKLLGYWDAIDQRLYRIRHCMNAQGVVRDLPPFSPPIDPGLLVAAAAAGVDLDSVLDDLYAPLPAYRFTVMLQKALDLCNEVRALGSEMLAALEKRDGERLALLRANHELSLFKAVKQIKVQQVEEANDNLRGLEAYQTVVTARQQYYQTREFMNSFENVHIQLSTAALLSMAMQLGAEIAGAVLHLVPDLKIGAPTTDGATYGGTNIGSAIQSFGGAMGTTAGVMNAMGSLSATLGGFRRRQDEWDFQADVATKELAQVTQQIAAANVRVSIAEDERDNQDLQISQSQEVYDFLREKYSNADLYDWMVSQLSAVYFQSYKLAFDMAKRAERAYRHDLGLTNSNFIEFGYWDSLKKGLLSGERLQFDLRRMESDYFDKNRREFEIVKHVSLLLQDPLALVQLKETGQCEINLPEMLFDVDFPGHYLRRLKAVALSIPCVVGPYASVNCTLTLLTSRVRTTSAPNSPYAEQPNDRRFFTSTNPVQSVAVSQAQNDSGLFELNFRDERYLPFEGEGVISTWRIQLATDFKSFDHGTISDAILHLRYTARDGGDDLKRNAVENLSQGLNTFVHNSGQKGLARLFSLRDDFPVQWDQFKNPPLAAGDQTATVKLDKTRLPLLFQSRTLTMSSIIAFAKPAAGFADTYTASALKVSLQAGSSASANALKLMDWNDFLRSESVAANPFGDWTLAAWLVAGDGTHQRLDPKGLEDVVLLVGYTVA